MKRNLVWVCLIVGAVLLVGALQWTGDQKSGEDSLPNSPQNPVNSRRSARSEPTVAAPQGTPIPAARAVASVETTPKPLSPTEDVVRHQEDAEHQLASEPVDPRWAATTASAITEEVGQLAGVDLVELECRSQSCFVELGFEPEEMDPTALADRLSVIAPWPAYVVSEVRTEPPFEAWAWLRQIDAKPD